jgi:hypothetical protein
MDVEKYPCVKGCGNFVIFTSKDRDFFIKMGFVNEKGEVNKPKLCKSCKAKSRQNRPVNFKKPVSYR